MALLVFLGIIGALAILVSLYMLGIEVAAAIVAYTSLFKFKVTKIVEKAKKSREDKKATKSEQKVVAQEPNKPEIEEIKDETKNLIEELK